MEDSADWTVKLADIANLLDAAGQLMASAVRCVGVHETRILSPRPTTWGPYEADFFSEALN